jgi:hypothetical protein
MLRIVTKLRVDVDWGVAIGVRARMNDNVSEAADAAKEGLPA